MNKVAIIEDDAYFRDDLEYFFRDSNVNVELFSNAEQFLKESPKIDNYKGVVLDLMMRKGSTTNIRSDESSMSGGEVIHRRIRETGYKRPILVVTAKNENEIFHEVLSDPNTKVLYKPVEDIQRDIVDVIRSSY